MTYVDPHMVQALSRHVLTVFLDTEQVRVYRMARPNDSAFRVQITCTPEGIAIQGDIGLGPNQHGICSPPGYGPGWFGRRQSEGYLCSKFLAKTWQRRVVTTDLARWLDDARNELRDTIDREVQCRPDETREEILADTDFNDVEGTVRSWEEIQAAWNEDETSEGELYEIGSEHFTDFWDYSIGTDYPLADAGWLCAIQRRFAELYTEMQG
jgi:hypothetical protein